MLTDDQITKFQNALKNPAPAYDPNWDVTQQLLKLVTLQSKQLLNLQAQLDALTESNESSSEDLLNALRQSVNLKSSTPLDETQVDAAIANLNKAIQSVNDGKKAIEYAGNILKFAATLLL